MHDYRKLALMLRPIEEKDLILYDMSAEDKAHSVRQFNRALLNAQKDGTDVAQIILKPLITKYPTWGDTALIYGLCLAREKQYKRAADALEYAVNNSLASEQHLTVAQEAMKAVKADENEPSPEPEARKGKRNISSMVGEGPSNPAARTAVQAPILMKASTGRNDFKLATEKERRDIMMRSGSGGDEMNDDVSVENVRTSADNMRLAVRIAAIVIAVAAALSLVIFLIIPTAARVRNSKDTEARLDFLLSELDKRKDDPEVAEIIGEYAEGFGAGNASGTQDDQQQTENTETESREAA